MAQEIGFEHQRNTTVPGRHRGAGEQEPGGEPRRPARSGPGRLSGRRLERRSVRVEDPALSPGTNEWLTAELRDAVGATSVEVPADRPHVSRGEPSASGAVITMNRIMLAMSLAIVLVIASVVALTTGSWWLLPVAAGVHAAGTLLVVTVAVRLTRDVEHPSPALAAAMNAEGIAGADHRFSEMVEEFRPLEPEDTGTWEDERTARPQNDPAAASVEQSRSLTATSQPSSPAPDLHATDMLIASLGLGLAVASAIIALAAGGGWIWLLPAVIVPLCAAGVSMNFIVRPGEDGTVELAPSRALLMLWAMTVVGVAVFCGLTVLFVAG